MIGAIAGDIVGSIYEFDNHRSKEFELFKSTSTFTDDTVLTVAVADAILEDDSYGNKIWDYANRYPDESYGGRFIKWMNSPNPEPYNSWGNGSAMRVSPIGFAFNSISKVLIEAEKSAKISHNHPEGIKGAQATALAIYLARQGTDKQTIKNEISKRFGYNLDRTVVEIRPFYIFNESCQETVPEAIISFLESNSFEDAIRTAVSLGGDTDTLTCITGGIAAAFYGIVPEKIVTETKKRLPRDLLEVTERFEIKYGIKPASLRSTTG